MILGFFSNLREDDTKQKYISNDTKFGAHPNFSLFSKVNINGPQTHPLFQFLRANSPFYIPQKKLCKKIQSYGGAFLLDKNGNVVRFYRGSASIKKLIHDIQNLLLLT